MDVSERRRDACNGLKLGKLLEMLEKRRRGLLVHLYPSVHVPMVEPECARVLAVMCCY